MLTQYYRIKLKFRLVLQITIVYQRFHKLGCVIFQNPVLRFDSQENLNRQRKTGDLPIFDVKGALHSTRWRTVFNLDIAPKFSAKSIIK